MDTLFNRQRGDFHPALQQLQQRELTLGIDLRAEKNTFLKHWQQERQQAEKLALKKHQDFFPLLELLVFGTLAALHLSPVLQKIVGVAQRLTLPVPQAQKNTESMKNNGKEEQR